jgi:thiol-disulfide isomerase/thioredoxin
MKNSMLRRTLTVLTLVAFAVATRMAEAKLTVGELAPKLQVAQWVQGEPVKEFDTNHVYIVEFWATWCGPCRASIPHLNELWQEFKDKGVIAIGQDVWEPDNSGVAVFVKKMGDKMTYRVALDDSSHETNGFMAVNWMKAADQHGIPTAFIINKQGRIAWIGHPMGLNAQLLEEILADKFDIAAFAQKYEKQQQEEAQREALYTKLRQAMREKNWDAADAAVAELEKSMPEQMRSYSGVMRLQILLGRKDYDGASKLAESLSDAHQDNANLQNGLAWTLAVTKEANPRCLALAEKIAERANTIANGKDPAILDTLARAQFMNGKTNEAVVTEQKVVDIAPDEAKSFYKKFLTDYQQGKLPEIKE